MDLGSAGGTHVDGRQVTSPLRLRHRQQILLGQRTVVRPYVVRFEDPSEQILIDLGIDEAELAPAREVGTGAGAPDAEAPGEPSGGSAATPAGLPEEAGRAAVHGPGALERPPAPAFDPSLRPRRSRWPRGPAAFVALALCVAALGLAAWGLLQVLRPSAAVWRSVQISPPSLSAGSELVLQSPDIHPGDDLEVFVANERVAERDRRRGRFIATVPTVEPRAAGVYNVPLVVKRRKIEIYQRMVEYAVRPVIAGVSPAVPEVGDTLTITGSGFADSPSEVVVRFGDERATPVASSPSRIAVRVPVLTRTVPLRVPVEISIGDWTTTLPEPLSIHPRTERPLDFEFQASYDWDREAWLVSHAFGPAFYVTAEAPAAADAVSGEWRPAEVEAVLRRWQRAFDLAASEPDLRIGVESQSGRSALIAERTPPSESFELVGWRDADLLRLTTPGGDVSAAILCNRMAGIWDQFLDVFARGKELPAVAGQPAYAGALNRLVAENRQGGGRGRPEQREVERLVADELAALERAFLPVPSGLGSVAGRWLIELENVFLVDRELSALVTLDLEQRRGRLSGQASLTMSNGAMRWSLPATPVSGRLAIHQSTTVELEMQFGRPVGRLVLEGALGDTTLTGTFRATRGARTGAWQAVREVTPSSQPPAAGSIDGAQTAWMLDLAQSARIEQ